MGGAGTLTLAVIYHKNAIGQDLPMPYTVVIVIMTPIPSAFT
jgi:hypothetical protein